MWIGTQLETMNGRLAELIENGTTANQRLTDISLVGNALVSLFESFKEHERRLEELERKQ